MRGRSFALVAAAFAVAACHGKNEEVPRPAASVARPEAAPSPADAGPVCAAVDAAKVAPFVADSSAVATPVPPIVDPKGALASFHEHLLALARGMPGTVRIGVYGDSNLTSDFMTGHMRRALQARFGDGGHGYVALARPWGWYVHEDVHHHGTWPLFKQLASTTDPVFGHRYGFANFGAESSTPGAAAWAGTAGEASVVGRTAGRFEVYFLKQPHGGRFDLLLDKKVLRTVSTAADDFDAGFETIETTDAAHEVKCAIKGDGTVRLYGTTLEREAGGIVVDSLGAGALNFQRFMLTEPVIRKAQLARRAYDLVVVWLGMNSMWLGPNRAWSEDTVATIRDAIPGVPVLLLTPPDSVKMGEGHTDPRILALVKQLREVAEETGAAFWDFRSAMGGDAAFLEFMKRGLASNDRVHLSKEGGELMGQRLLSALFEDLAAHRARVPDAGCKR